MDFESFRQRMFGLYGIADAYAGLEDAAAFPGFADEYLIYFKKHSNILMSIFNKELAKLSAELAVYSELSEEVINDTLYDYCFPATYDAYSYSRTKLHYIYTELTGEKVTLIDF